MKAITIWQPWATLIALGLKQYETRGWDTKVRGRIYIHAAVRRPVIGDMSEAVERRVIELLRASGAPPLFELPLGRIVCHCELVDAEPVELLLPTDDERTVGDWRPGRFAWRLADVRPYVVPFPWKGKQGWFTVPDHHASIASA